MTPILNTVVPLQEGSGGSVELLVVILFTLVVAAGFWKTFEKAGQPGWAAIIPIYNFYILIKISGNAWWWLVLFFVPVANFVAVAKISIDVAGKFDKGFLFGIGLMFLSFVFYPVLGFGDSRYRDTTQSTGVP